MSTTSEKPYRGLIVDFGGVLSTSFEGALQSFCVREGLAPDALEQVFSLDDGAKGMLVDLECGLIGQAEFVAHLAATLGVNPDGLLERMVAELRLEPKVTNAVQQVRQQGVRVAVLSNSWGSHPFDPYRPFHLAEQFDAVVISDQVGLRKPDPKIFTLTAERLGLPPADCVFVDDVARYLTPAQELGMGTIHATDPDTTVSELSSLLSLPNRLLSVTSIDPATPADVSAPPVRTHEMSLSPRYFDLIITGRKTTEIRVNDSSRQRIKEGSLIRFRCQSDEVLTRVTRISRYHSFTEMFDHEPVTSVNPQATREEQLADLRQIYPPEREALGVVAIGLELVNPPRPA